MTTSHVAQGEPLAACVAAAPTAAGAQQGEPLVVCAAAAQTAARAPRP
jgi:hypothetical protein